MAGDGGKLVENSWVIGASYGRIMVGMGRGVRDERCMNA